MSTVKGGAAISLSREAVARFFEDQLLPFGPFHKHHVDLVTVTPDNSSEFLTLYLSLLEKLAIEA